MYKLNIFFQIIIYNSYTVPDPLLFSCENQAETLRLFPLFRIEFREPSFALYGLLFAVEKMCETDEVSAPLLTGAAILVVVVPPLT